jgi:hypothetical protein
VLALIQECIERGTSLEPEDPVEAEGTIENWEVGPEGSVDSIHVRFADGDPVEYQPSQRELRRME